VSSDTSQPVQIERPDFFCGASGCAVASSTSVGGASMVEFESGSPMTRRPSAEKG
jgi:hypothetical protein